MVAGANEEEYHFANVNLERDFKADLMADIAYAEKGSPCASCASSLESHRGVEVGNIFQLGTRYSDAMNCTYLDDTGNQKPIFMGSYGIGIGRLLACVVEEYHDEHGIIWPPQLAPYQLYLVNLASDPSHGETLYRLFTERGWEVLFDDRDDRAGVKFNDADLIGVPIRITVGDRALAGGNVEVKLRWEKESSLVSVTDIETEIEKTMQELEAVFTARFPLNR